MKCFIMYIEKKVSPSLLTWRICIIHPKSPAQFFFWARFIIWLSCQHEFLKLQKVVIEYSFLLEQTKNHFTCGLGNPPLPLIHFSRGELNEPFPKTLVILNPTDWAGLIATNRTPSICLQNTTLWIMKFRDGRHKL